MNEYLKKDPVLLFPGEIKEICSPLNLVNISYFSHVRVFDFKYFSALSNHPKFHEIYLQKKYYNADIHLASQDMGQYIIWDAIDCYGQSEKMNQDAEALGIRHTFTIVEKQNTVVNYYHFSTHLMDHTINQDYFRNLELLKMFINYFKETINQSKIFAKAYDHKYTIDNGKSAFSSKYTQNNKDQNILSSLFLNQIRLDKSIRSKMLSIREIEVLTWLHQGKTFNQVAQILGVSDITIKKHISNIKQKTCSYTLFQLGEYYAKQQC